ncbi:hypothetical protein DXA21_06320, partial [Parabacteroides distasonis]
LNFILQQSTQFHTSAVISIYDIEKGKSKKAKDNTLPLITTNVLFKPLFSSFQKIFVKKNTLSCIIQAIHKVRMVYPTNCSQFSIASTSTVIPKRVTA